MADIECISHLSSFPEAEFATARNGERVHLKPNPHFAVSGWPAKWVDGGLDPGWVEEEPLPEPRPVAPWEEPIPGPPAGL